MKKFLFLILLASFGYAAASVPANTNNAKLNGVYAGVQLGYANLNYDKSYFKVDSIPVDVDVQSSGAAGRIFGGYQFNKNLALELGYTYLPKVSVKTKYYDAKFDFNELAFDLSAKGILPLNDKLNLYGKFGIAEVYRTNAKVHFAGYNVSHDSDNKTVPLAGAGVSYNLTEHVAVDVSYTRYFKNDDLPAIDFTAIGVSYKF